MSECEISHNVKLVHWCGCINQLMFMDDLKLLGKYECQIYSLINTVSLCFKRRCRDGVWCKELQCADSEKRILVYYNVENDAT